MKRIFLTFLSLLSLITVYSQSLTPTISFAEVVYDFKDIVETAGPVDRIFNFTNTGNQPLVIHNVQASCGCTTPDWTKNPIPPGGKGFVKATYNPAGRPGQFNKSITVMSNASQPSMVLRIIGNVIPKPKSVNDEYPRAFGELRAKGGSLSFTKIGPNEKKTEVLEVINTSNKDLKVQFEGVPAHLQLRAIPEVIKPGANGVIEGIYDAKLRNDWGFVVDNVVMVINGVPDAQNRLSVSATIAENFSTLTPAELENAPVASFDNISFNFGEIKVGDKVVHNFILTNTGKSDLIIRKIKASCGCTAVTPEKSIIAPGESTKVGAQFDSTGRSGTQSKSITVITNDPKSSTIILQFTANVNAGTM